MVTAIVRIEWYYRNRLLLSFAVGLSFTFTTELSPYANLLLVETEDLRPAIGQLGSFPYYYLVHTRRPEFLLIGTSLILSSSAGTSKLAGLQIDLIFGTIRKSIISIRLHSFSKGSPMSPSDSIISALPTPPHDHYYLSDSALLQVTRTVVTLTTLVTLYTAPSRS